MQKITTRNDMQLQKQHADDVSSSSRFKWKIENISKLNDENRFSPTFRIGPHKWGLLAFRRGCNTNGYLSIYVVAIECKEWQFAKFSLSIVDQTNNINTLKKDTKDMFRFTKDESDWGFDEFIHLKELKDPSNGYILNDACIVEVEFCLDSLQDFKEELVPLEHMESVEERDSVTMSTQQCDSHRKLDKKINKQLADKIPVAKVEERPFCIEITASTSTLLANTSVCLDNDSALICAFCQTSTVSKGSGSMLHIANGEEVKEDEVSAGPNVVHVHRKCLELAPRVYYVGQTVMNLELELTRVSKLKCCCCGLKGAALGCFVRSCRNTYHVPCAFDISGCRWDDEGRLMLCPSHTGVKFSYEKTNRGKFLAKDNSSAIQRLQKVKQGKKSISPPLKPHRKDSKLLTAVHRGEFVEPGMLKFHAGNDTQPSSSEEQSDSDEIDEDQSIPADRGGNDDDDGIHDDRDNRKGEILEKGVKENEVPEEGNVAAKSNVEEKGNNVEQLVEGAKATKDKKPNKPIDCHMPLPHMKKTVKLGDPLLGLPEDGGQVLFGYKDSWAYEIYSTIDHKNCIRLLRRQASNTLMKAWPLKKECQAVKEIVKSSGLWPAVKNSVVEYDKVVISAFCERFYGETDTMLFPFGEMAITPDDSQQILGLELDGKSIQDGYDDNIPWEDLHKLTKSLLGWDEKKSESMFIVKGGYRSKKLNLKMLRDTYSGTADIFEKEGSVDEVRVRATATAYLLYILASCVFPDSSGNMVEGKYLQLLHPLDEVHKYSWGTAVVGHLNGELKKASRALTKQVNGNLSLFQIWIYEHFPSLVKANPHIEINADLPNHKPRGRKYKFKGSQEKHMPQQLINMRVALDNMTADEVIFDPYRKERTDHILIRRDEVAFYSGPLFFPNGFSMYDPSRIMRQLGYVQEEPNPGVEPFFKVERAECSTSQKTIEVVYSPKPETSHWDERRDRRVDVSLLELVTHGHEAHDNYMPWYSHFAHPRVIREEVVQPTRKENTVKDPTTRLKNFKDNVNTLVKMMRCARDRGEPWSVQEQTKYIDFVRNLANEDATEMFYGASLELKRPRSRGGGSQGSQRGAKRGRSGS